MAEMVLPGTYIEVRPEGLIVPSRVSVGTIGVVGTAQKGPVGEAVFLGSYVEARDRFGDYDAWIDGASDELTLVRAIQLAHAHGGTSFVAVRVAAASAAAATYVLASAAGEAVRLTAASAGAWGNEILVAVEAADEPAVINDETHAGAAAVSLDNTPILKNGRNRIQLASAADGVTRSLAIIYDDDPAVPSASQVKIDRASGALTFGVPLDPADAITATYVVDPSSAKKVSLKHGNTAETYTVVSGTDLVNDLADSDLVTAAGLANAGQALADVAEAKFGTGANTAGDSGAGAGDAEYLEGLNVLLNEPAHIIVGAGRTDEFAADLNGHCQLASSDALRRDRIGVVGSALDPDLDDLRGHTMDSDRIVFVAPGIQATDASSGEEVTLPGAYAAAAIAGLLSSYPAHVSLTNKSLSVRGLETVYTPTELSQLVQSRVLALELRQGFRVVKGITTATNTAWHQITTRRIVDYAKFGVRSAASSYPGLLNNERVRTALRTTIASFLNEMVSDEMLISYDLDVSATREEERQGIVRVTMILRPTFSIDFIKVTMFLE
jgi:hypothetical protein